MIEIVPLDSIHGAPYNPRVADAARSELLELSLRKLGFLSPLFVDSTGMLLSGHQRRTRAQMLGYTKLPVIRVQSRAAKNINMLFNRATNDMGSSSTGKSLFYEIDQRRVAAIAESTADVPIDTFPCATSVKIPTSELLRINGPTRVRSLTLMARQLRSLGAELPVVIDDQKRIINGHGRIERAGTIDCIQVLGPRAELAKILLNGLSMDFQIDDSNLANDLRHNSHRAPRNRRKVLGSGFTFGIHSGAVKDFNLTANAEQWKNFYGTSVVDFGAGHLDEAQMLRSIGVAVNPFEPYHCAGRATPDLMASRNLGVSFLKRIETEQYSSVFASSIFNSIPFPEDRRMVACLLAELCRPKGVLFVSTRGTNDGHFQATKRGVFDDGATAQLLGHEETVMMGGFSATPKLQKIMTGKEAGRLFGEFFFDVKAKMGGQLFVICRDPKPPRWDLIEQAARFEFDLPYPANNRLGLADQAVAAFRARTERLQ